MENRIEYVKTRLADQIEAAEMCGFGYLGPVLRVALFSNQLTTDQWRLICDEFDKQNPEQAWKE